MTKKSKVINLLTITLGLVIAISVFQIAVWMFSVPSFPISNKSTISVSNLGKFSILNPAEWVFTETPKGYLGDSSVVSLLNYPNILKIGVSGSVRETVDTLDSLTKVAEWGGRIAESKPGYRETSSDQLRIKDEQVFLREYRWIAPAPLQGGQPMRCLDNYRVHDTRAYILTLCVNEEDFARLKPIFIQTIESFAYLD